MPKFFHAERAGLWGEHLIELEKMLTYLVAVDHYKLSCLAHYLQAMEKYLQQTKSR